MKTFAKQALCGLLALLLMLSLVACGGDGDTTATTTAGDDVVTTTSSDSEATTTTVDGETQPSGNSTSKTSATSGNNKKEALTWKQVKSQMPANLSGTTIKVFNWNQLKSITGGPEAVAKFTEETGIKVEWDGNGSYAEYVTQIAAKQQAKDAPDMIRLKETNPALLTLLQPLADTGYDFTDAAWDTAVMGAYTYKGKVYAANMANTLMQQPDVLLYDSKMIKNYSLDDPYTLWKQGKWTWNKFVEVCTDFKEEAGDDLKALSPFYWQMCSQIMGVDLVQYTQDGFKSGLTSAADYQKLVKGFQLFIKFKTAGLCGDSLYQRTAFEAGNILFMHDAIIGARKTHFYYTNMKSAGTLRVVPLPSIDGVNEYYQLYSELEGYGIPSGAKNAKAVPYFLRYFLDGNNYNEKTFFAHTSILEVYKYCLSIENVMQPANYKNVLTKDSGLYALPGTIARASEAQVDTQLKAKAGVIQSLVKDTNQKLDQLTK